MGLVWRFLTFFFLMLSMGESISHGHGRWPPMFFDVKRYGAIADGKTDNSMENGCFGHGNSPDFVNHLNGAFLSAWRRACEWKGKSRMFIPKGTYMLNSVIFMGPCNGPVSFIIKGVLKAPTDPNLFFLDHWIGFQYVDRLVVKGGGYLDGQGPSAWPYNDCSANPNCKPLPVSMRFDFVTNSRVHHLRSINSKNSHFNLFACNNVNISHIRISAPQGSPNTDGIHIGTSSNIRISRSVIGTGDDCISMVSGSRNIDISSVSCGPGHGISVGSLGKSPKEFVTGISVTNCTFIGTQNGVRIKTWAPSFASIASDFIFQDIFMDNVNNPIIIDQQYCPQPNCNPNAHNSQVEISNVTFRNIWGTSSSKVAVSLICSGIVPCHDIKLININLSYNGPQGPPATSTCSNVRGQSYGPQNPSSCI